MKGKSFATVLFQLVIIASLSGVFAVSAAPALTGVAAASPAVKAPAPTVTTEVAFDKSPALRSLAKVAAPAAAASASADDEPVDIRPDRGPVVPDQGYSGDGALQSTMPARLSSAAPAPAIPGPLGSFEGLSNQDNFNMFGFRVNPPDPMGDVGPNHYVELINLALAVYDKQGNLLLGPTAIGDIWAGFAVPDCTDPSGDPVVLYDQFMDRWLLSQFTTS